MKFDVIYADPPYRFDNKKTGGSFTSGAAQHYPVLDWNEVFDLPIERLAKENAALFLWIPVPMLDKGIDLLYSWGFTYKTSLFWHKKGRFGMGYWYRNCMEILLVGIRGDVRAFRCQFSNVIQLPVLGHSIKPREFLKIIEVSTEGMGARTCLELFAREDAQNWVCIGEELSGNDIRQDIKTLLMFEEKKEGENE